MKKDKNEDDVNFLAKSISSEIFSSLSNEDANMRIYAWDFALSDGLTNTDKYHDLFEKILKLTVVDKNNDCEFPKVVGNYNLICGFCVLNSKKYDFEENPVYCEDHLHDFQRTGKDFSSGFKLYKDETIPKDEIRILFSEDSENEKLIRVKIFNFPF